MRRQSRNLYSQCTLLFNKKPREQWKFRNICLHMAKINTYDYLSIHTHPIYFSVEHYRPYKKRPKIRCYMEIMQQQVFGRFLYGR